LQGFHDERRECLSHTILHESLACVSMNASTLAKWRACI